MRHYSGADSGSHPADQARSGLGASRVDPGQRSATDYEAWRPALVAFYKADAWFQSAENLERGAELNSGDRRIIDALIEAAERMPRAA